MVADRDQELLHFARPSKFPEMYLSDPWLPAGPGKFIVPTIHLSAPCGRSSMRPRAFRGNTPISLVFGCGRKNSQQVRVASVIHPCLPLVDPLSGIRSI